MMKLCEEIPSTKFYVCFNNFVDPKDNPAREVICVLHAETINYWLYLDGKSDCDLAKNKINTLSLTG